MLLACEVPSQGTAIVNPDVSDVRQTKKEKYYTMLHATRGEGAASFKQSSQPGPQPGSCTQLYTVVHGELYTVVHMCCLVCGERWKEICITIYIPQK